MRRHRLLTRAAPLIVVAAIAFAIGIVMALQPGREERRLVSQYVTAWTHADYARMYGLLDAVSRQQASENVFAAELRGAADTATVVSMKVLHVGGRSGATIPVRMAIRTRLWSTLRETLEVPLSGSGSGARVHFTGTLAFPGLRPGERLTRRIGLPQRASLLASNGTPLAEGPGRTSPIPDVAGEIVGLLGPVPSDQTAAYAALGYPSGTPVGLDGLERVFQNRLVGTLGGKLLAGRRLLASATPAQAAAVTTTIDPPIERAATAAIAGRYAGIAVMNPRTGALVALAGVAFSALQPPGSTMKIVTATGALQAGIVKLTTQFPVRSSASIEGFSLSNAGGESCGGTFLNAFAVSCNTVFAPLGARLGARRLVSIAERFGFNQPPSIPGASESTIPAANAIGDALAVASSAIGQGMVQTSALGMTDVAATIAMGGRRPIPTLLAHQPPRFVHVTSRRIARLVQRMMIAVVQFGTGTSAQIPGVTVAGKTGTAELRNTSNPNDPNASNPKNTDSWFVGYAPVGHPRFVVGALFPAQGAGAQTAAPAVHNVLAAALQTH
jgi:cell division protein FtsI/penicillin-binding protein 2